MNAKSKTGQITVFIIIGVILLFAAALILYIKTQLGKENPEADLPSAPTKVEPVAALVERCLSQVSKEAIEKIGMHGGYISPQEYGLSLNPIHPTEADALSIIPDSGFDVAYWHYLASENDCTECAFSSAKPPLRKGTNARIPSVEKQISDYTTQNLQACLNSFEGLKPEFDVVVLGEPMPTTTITDEKVIVNLNFPLSITAQGEQFEHKVYRSTHDISLPRIFGAAQNIVETQKAAGLLEKQTMDWIQAASMPGPSSDRMPPIFSQDTDCGTGTVWLKTDVEQNKLKPMLQSYTPSILFQGSKNYRAPDFDTMQTAFYSQNIFPTNATLMHGLSARASYMGWPVYFDITPRSGEMLGKIDIGIGLKIFSWCQHLYEYSYQLSHPLLFEVNDALAFGGEGYTLYFAMESNIRNNRALKAGSVDFSSNIALEDSSFGVPEHRLSGNVTVTVKDSMTGEYVNDVKVDFCIPDARLNCIDTVVLGRTGQDEDGKLVETLPLGYGLLITSREGYHTGRRAFLSRVGKEAEIEFNMHPYKSVPVKIEKKLIMKNWLSNKWYLSEYNDTLDVTETAIVSFQRLTEHTDEPHEQFITLSYIDSVENITLIPGKYLLQVQIIDNDNLYVPADERCERPCFICSKTCYTIPEIDIEQFPTGGVLLSDETGGFFEITKEDLKMGKGIKLKVPSIVHEHITIHEDMQQIGQFEAYSKMHWTQLEPDWYDLPSSS